MSGTLRLLQVEDSESDAALIVRLLGKSGYTVHSERVENAGEMRAALANQPWDVIVCDYHLPQLDAPTALKLLQEMGIDIPFIVVSGAIGEEIAVGMMKSGAHDYVMKRNLPRLMPAIEREIREAAIRRERRQADDALRVAREEADRERRLLDAVFVAQTDAVLIWGADGVVVRTNPAAAGFFGFDLKGSDIELTGWLGSTVTRRALGGETVVNVEHTARDLAIETSAAPMRNRAGEIVGAVTISRDITQRKRSEERLRQTQRLESIGLLAGGIAHDFNNILTAVSGNIALALEDSCPDCQAASVLPIALESVQRAAGLTRQLLAYAGKGAFVRASVPVAEIAQNTILMLRASTSKKVELRTELEANLSPVLMDPSQMEQIILNLVLNGIEAIGEGRAGTVTLAASERNGFVRIEVSDTGCGMDQETQKRIFEPFFTTKFTGRGLGLAAVAGIVRSLNGEISVSSGLGRGTSIQVLLPVSKDRPASAEARPPPVLPSAGGTVLVVDDEPQIRKMAAAYLKKRGITVVEAANGKEAIDRIVAGGTAIRVVLLDIAMPEMTGDQALLLIAKVRPDIHVIVSSGYGGTEVKQHFEAMKVRAFLPKPYSGDQLLAHVLPALAEWSEGHGHE